MKFIKKIFGLLIFVLIVVVIGFITHNESAKDEIISAKNNISSTIADSIQKESTTNKTIDLSQYDGPYTVSRVVDGDTFICNVEGISTRVRMIGVDTPESVSSDENKNCEEGKIASDYTKSTLTGKQVYLEYDVGKYDKYNRVLAYVYLEDGSMYNETLLELGYARTMTVQPNSKYANEFNKIQAKARKSKVGFWDGFEQWENN